MATTDQGPEDDGSIHPPTLLYRWVAPAHIRRTDAGVECRDGAFKNFPNPAALLMSVVIEDTLREHHRQPGSVLDGRPGYGLVALTAGQVRGLEQRIMRSPLPDELAHGDVWGEKPVSRRRRLAQAAEWIIVPPAAA